MQIIDMSPNYMNIDLDVLIRLSPDLRDGNISKEIGDLGAVLESYSLCIQKSPTAAIAWVPQSVSFKLR